MPINFVTGLPRTGKTLFTFIQVIDRAKKENRPVYYCNIPEVTIPGWIEIDHPDKWMECPNDSIIIVDELQDFWGDASPGTKVPLPILELSKHGKRGIDFYFITQDPTLVHKTPRKLCETHWNVIRAFGTEKAMAHKFSRMQTDPEKVKNKADKYPWSYPKEAFGKKDKAGNWITKPWYKSADVHNIRRQIPLKLIAIPGGILVAGLAVWIAFSFFGNFVENAKNPTGAKSAVGAKPASAASGANVPTIAKPASAEEYVLARLPRLPSFPHTAPVYDEVTKPTHAPYPAACVQSASVCKCYTQQGTLLRVEVSVCARIVAEGFFIDWDAGRGQQQQAHAPAPHQTAPTQEAHQVQSMPAPLLVASAPSVPAPALPAPSKNLGYLESLRLRNAEVRSVLR